MAEDNREVQENLKISKSLYNLEAEEAVLGAMLFDDFGLQAGLDSLKKEDFFKKENQIMFEIFKNLHENRQSVDMVTVIDRLSSLSLVETVGGAGFITNIINAVPTSANIASHIIILKEKSKIRGLDNITKSISEQIAKGEFEAETIAENTEVQLLEILQDTSQADFTPMHEIVTTNLETLEAVSKTTETVTGITTGFRDLDNKTAGLQKADLILVAARPSMGKTAFVLNIAQHAAVKKKHKVAIFSLEMSKEQLVNRIMCSYSGVDSQKYRTGDLELSDWEKIAESVQPLSEANLFIDDTAAISLSKMRSKCRKLSVTQGLDLVIIDYLQLMSGNNPNNRQQEISDISRGLKSLAREFGVPVIALSQLSRAVESRSDKRPMLSDLRESGAIEQDADLVCFLYRDDYYNKESEDVGLAELNIAKQRNGSTGTIKLGWQGQYTRFVTVAQEAYSSNE